ncbi:MAG: response regulator [Candidatus Margulisiibacteriota bacterium]
MVQQPPIYDLGLNSKGKQFQFFVIDDALVMVRAISRAISQFGGSVIGSTTNSIETINLLTPIKDRIDVITLDIHMPGKDGLVLLPEIRVLCPHAKIIMVTASGHVAKVKEAIMLGANHFVVKPFQTDQLYQIIKSVVNSNPS